jgi:hypothetical protein
MGRECTRERPLREATPKLPRCIVCAAPQFLLRFFSSQKMDMRVLQNRKYSKALAISILIQGRNMLVHRVKVLVSSFYLTLKLMLYLEPMLLHKYLEQN